MRSYMLTVLFVLVFNIGCKSDGVSREEFQAEMLKLQERMDKIIPSAPTLTIVPPPPTLAVPAPTAPAVPPTPVESVLATATATQKSASALPPRPKVPKKRKSAPAPTPPSVSSPASSVLALPQVSENTAFYLKMGTGNSAVILAEADWELAKAKTEKTPITKWRRTLSGRYLPVPFEYGWQDKMQ